jgi:hypothetical protein
MNLAILITSAIAAMSLLEQPVGTPLWKSKAPRYAVRFSLFSGREPMRIKGVWVLEQQEEPRLCVYYEGLKSDGKSYDVEGHRVRTCSLRTGATLGEDRLGLFRRDEEDGAAADKVIALNLTSSGVNSLLSAQAGPLGILFDVSSGEEPRYQVVRPQSKGYRIVHECESLETPCYFDGDRLILGRHLGRIGRPRQEFHLRSISEASDSPLNVPPDTMYLVTNGEIHIGISRREATAIDKSGRVLWKDDSLNPERVPFAWGGGRPDSFAVRGARGVEVRAFRTNKVIFERPQEVLSASSIHAVGDLLLFSCLIDRNYPSPMSAKGEHAVLLRSDKVIWEGHVRRSHLVILRAGPHPLLAGDNRVIAVQSGRTFPIDGSPVLWSCGVLVTCSTDFTLFAYALPEDWK